MAQLTAKFEPAPAEWYQIQPVIYGFNIPKVRVRLEWLMGSHIVLVLDKGYHHMLQSMIEEDFHRTVKARNLARKKEELNREKQLVLEGKMSIANAPKDILSHPVVRINMHIETVMRERDAKLTKQAERRSFTYQYSDIETVMNAWASLNQDRAKGKGFGEYSESETGSIGRKRVEFASRDSLISEETRITLIQRPFWDDVANLSTIKKVKDLYRRGDLMLGFEPQVEEYDDDKTDDEDQEDGEDGDEQDDQKEAAL